ncbi:MAG TPA: Glu/Leu/Phe/Val dehydrogenase [Actinomycetes bacterium]|nr:Glu/Leu/Phe/Val dehydrogenase [Actinomycetes bacterium]
MQSPIVKELVVVMVLELPDPDRIGPEQVVVVNDAQAGRIGFVVVDNLAAGPAIGGVRMAPDVTVAEVARLARAMTLKNAAAGLPHGGAKAGIVADSTLPFADKVRIVRWFGHAIRDIVGYIPGPDMGLDERLMAHLRDSCGRAVGLPAVLGGIPLDELGATGFGLAVAADVAAERGVLDLAGAGVVVQGFGSVGTHVARFLAERGARVVAVSDSRGAVADAGGLDVTALITHKAAGRPVSKFAGGRAVDPEDLVGMACDIWVPAARPDVFTMENVGQVQARLVLEGANIPASREAEEKLHASGVVVLPDFVANSGGVICAAVEYAGGTRAQAFASIEEKIRANVTATLDGVDATGDSPRVVAERLAEKRVAEAMSYRVG